MPRLAELQALFARGLVADPDQLPRELFAPGPIPIEAALRVHRNTVLGALAKALALSFPTVAALVGEACFDQLAAAFAAGHVPTEARLSAYGGDFPAFIETAPQTAGLAWLADVARFDQAIHRAAAASLQARRIEIEPGITLSLPVSLTALELVYPADLIRDAVESGDETALAAIDLAPAPCWRAVWRGEAGAAARPLGPPAGRFLAALLAGRSPERALGEALAAAGPQEALAAVQSEVFAAPFAAILQSSEGNLQP